MKRFPHFLPAFPLALLLLGAGCPPGSDPKKPAPGTGSRPAGAGSFTNSIGMQLRRIPAGEFLMGSPGDEPGRLANEGPVHPVRITRPFYLGVHEVTVGAFGRFVEETGYRTEAERDVEGGFGIDWETGRVIRAAGIDWRRPGFPGFRPQDNHPVVLVSWEDAERFAEWLSRREERIYRLPTEAEWEYAARGGTTTAYSSGEEPESLRPVANLADRSLAARMAAVDWAEPWDDGHPFLAPVGAYAANPFGLFDMHGNLWEWTADLYEADYYSRSPAADPRGPDSGSFRTIRGGGWFNGAVRNRSAQRIYFHPSFRYCLLSGFRVLLEID